VPGCFDCAVLQSADLNLSLLTGPPVPRPQCHRVI
jgi:hypothetical protein